MFLAIGYNVSYVRAGHELPRDAIEVLEMYVEGELEKGVIDNIVVRDGLMLYSVDGKHVEHQRVVGYIRATPPSVEDLFISLMAQCI